MAKEYIERDAVINRLQTVSMPDDPYSKGIQHGVVHSIAVINEAPAADVVEVVRCKDCKYHNKAPCPMRLSLNWTKDNGFCSYGEKRDNNAAD